MAHPQRSWDCCLAPFTPHDHLQSQLETVVSFVFWGPPGGCCVNLGRVTGRGFTGVRNVFWSHCDPSQGHFCYIVGFLSMTRGPYTCLCSPGVRPGSPCGRRPPTPSGSTGKACLTHPPFRVAFLITCARDNGVSFEIKDARVGHFHDV